MTKKRRKITLRHEVKDEIKRRREERLAAEREAAIDHEKEALIKAVTGSKENERFMRPLGTREGLPADAYIIDLTAFDIQQVVRSITEDVHLRSNVIITIIMRTRGATRADAVSELRGHAHNTYLVYEGSYYRVEEITAQEADRHSLRIGSEPSRRLVTVELTVQGRITYIPPQKTILC